MSEIGNRKWDKCLLEMEIADTRTHESRFSPYPPVNPNYDTIPIQKRHVASLPTTYFLGMGIFSPSELLEGPSISDNRDAVA